MQGAGNFPVDLVLFAMVAAFLVLRLVSILGRRTGFEAAPPPLPPRSGGKGTQTPPARPEAAPEPRWRLPDPSGDIGQTLALMSRTDRRFDPSTFLAGAEQAFRLIVTGFAAGDRGLLKPLLTEETFAAFDRAIAEREASGQSQRTEIRSVDEVAITSAQLSGNVATIAVRFVSHQASAADMAGDPGTGIDHVAEIADLWTFERRLGQADLTWRLCDARSA